jgi:hypothetical protein
MSIKVKCPYGHELKVKDSMAGKTGLCPLCKKQVYVYVPVPEEDTLSEQIILDYLGPSQTAPKSSISSSGIELNEGSAIHRHDKDHHETPWKSCVKCNRDIPSQTHICPYCHTYIADLAGF